MGLKRANNTHHSEASTSLVCNRDNIGNVPRADRQEHTNWNLVALVTYKFLYTKARYPKAAPPRTNGKAGMQYTHHEYSTDIDYAKWGFSKRGETCPCTKRLLHNILRSKYPDGSARARRAGARAAAQTNRHV